MLLDPHHTHTPVGVGVGVGVGVCGCVGVCIFKTSKILGLLFIYSFHTVLWYALLNGVIPLSRKYFSSNLNMKLYIYMYSYYIY